MYEIKTGDSCVYRNPFAIIEEFEAALCAYTGAPYAVAVNSCTNALFLALKWWTTQVRPSLPNTGAIITIPKRTYVSVPMQIKHALCNVAFWDDDWLDIGMYELLPSGVMDCARYFQRDMYRPTAFMCVSFHWTKQLGIQHGGAILHDNPDADEWLRRARFDGRLPGEPASAATMIGWHCLTTPEVAAAGLVRLASLPDNPPPLPPVEYPDLSKLEIFK